MGSTTHDLLKHQYQMGGGRLECSNKNKNVEEYGVQEATSLCIPSGHATCVARGELVVKGSQRRLLNTPIDSKKSTFVSAWVSLLLPLTSAHRSQTRSIPQKKVYKTIRINKIDNTFNKIPVGWTASSARQ